MSRLGGLILLVSAGVTEAAEGGRAWGRMRAAKRTEEKAVAANECRSEKFGAGRGTRTPTLFPAADFESAASTDSAIPAGGRSAL